MAKVYQVNGVKRLAVAEFSSLENFKLTPLSDIQSFDHWHEHPNLLIPYAIDYKKRSVIFVETAISAVQLMFQNVFF
ncbi:MAG: hypothetical protein JKY01_13230 [Pseudomonadales bacterium]|nr:hypothetical protein [Pseudomonadales bacterium]